MEVADTIDRARLLQEQDRAGEALELLLAAAAEHPDEEDLKAEISFLYTDRGLGRPPEESDQSLADFTEARKWMELPLALAGTAKILSRRGDYAGAEALLRQALEADPELPEAHAQLGINRVSQGDMAAGAESLARTLELAPGHGPAYVWLASALEGLGRPEEAHRTLLEGRRRCPSDDRLLVPLGWSLAERAKDPAGAQDAWRRAIEINRGNADAWRGLAWAAAETGDEVEMIRSLDRSQSLDPEGTKSFLERYGASLPLLKKYVP